jgi:hypothetical protein
VTVDGRCFVVVGEASRLRRRLGPTAWAVLEELITRSDGLAERCESTSTTRSLAGNLGLAKDTVARALLRLRRAGIVTAAQHRTADGTFTTGSYVIAVPDCIILDADTNTNPTRPQRPTRPTGSQLALSLDG